MNDTEITKPKNFNMLNFYEISNFDILRKRFTVTKSLIAILKSAIKSQHKQSPLNYHAKYEYNLVDIKLAFMVNKIENFNFIVLYFLLR